MWCDERADGIADGSAYRCADGRSYCIPDARTDGRSYTCTDQSTDQGTDGSADGSTDRCADGCADGSPLRCWHALLLAQHT